MAGLAQGGAHCVLIVEFEIALAACRIDGPSARFQRIGHTARRVTQPEDQHLLHCKPSKRWTAAQSNLPMVAPATVQFPKQL